MVDVLKFININYLHSQLSLVNWNELLGDILRFPFAEKNQFDYFPIETCANVSRIEIMLVIYTPHQWTQYWIARKSLQNYDATY